MKLQDHRKLGVFGAPRRGRRAGNLRSRLRPEIAALEDRLLLATAGELDASFGSAGVAEVGFAPPFQMTATDQSAYGLAIDPSGNVVAAGYVDSEPGSDPDSPGTVAGISAAVARLTPAGSADSNFGPSGQVVINTSFGHQNAEGPVDVFNGIVQNSQGNTLFTSGNTSEMFLVGYHKDDGDFTASPQDEFSLDALSSTSGGNFQDAYGDDVVKTVSFTAFNPQDNGDWANAGLMQPDGTLLVTGRSGASDDQIPLARFETNGLLDTSFDSSGPQPGTELLNVPAETSNPSFELPDGVAALTFDGSAQILLAATAEIGGQTDAMVLSLNSSDDSINSSFGNGGVVLVPVPSSGTALGIGVDPNSGRIVVAGSNYLVALTSSGMPDTTFGTAGTGVVSIAGMTVNAMAIESDSKIVVAGSVPVSGTNNTIAALARYTESGALDTTFGSVGTGVVTTDIDSSGESTYYAVAIEPSDGKIDAAGYALDPSISNDATVIARYIGLTPVITQLSQTSARAGAASFTLTVTGSGFVNGSPGSAVDWNGTALATTFVSSTSLQATVPASDLQTAGTASITVTNPGDITSSAATFTISASPVVPTIMWSNPANIVYGTPLSATQLDAKASANGASIAGNFVYTPVSGTVLHVGASQKLSVAFTPTDTADYADASGSVSITVTKATPSLSIHAGPSVYDGNSQPATFTITGVNGDNLSSQVTLTYNGSTAAPVGAGTYTVNASFPGDSDYNAISETAQLVISQAVPVINWPAPAPISVGTPLSGTQLDATASTPGMFTYTPIAGTVLGAGSNQVVSLSFSPADSTDYQSTTASVLIDVLAQPAVIAVTPVQSRKGLTSITVLFNESMEQGSAASAANYSVLGAVKKKKHTVYTKSVGKLSLSYSASSRTVTITLKKPYKGMVQATASSGILAADGAATSLPFVVVL